MFTISQVYNCYPPEKVATFEFLSEAVTYAKNIDKFTGIIECNEDVVHCFERGDYINTYELELGPYQDEYVRRKWC